MLSAKLCHFDTCVVVLLNLFPVSWHFKQFEIDFLKTMVGKKKHNKKRKSCSISQKCCNQETIKMSITHFEVCT